MLVEQLGCFIDIEEMGQPADLMMGAYDDFLSKVEVVVQLCA